MASPAPGDAPNGIATPTNPAASQPSATSPPSATANPTPAGPIEQPTTVPAAPQQPPSSLTDSGLSKRPRDARLIHMVLAHLGVSAYQERVPLQLMDFAYRYTAGILNEAINIPEAAATGAKGGPGAAAKEDTVSLAAIRSAIAGKLQNQYASKLPKEFLLEMAQEKNRVGLPRAERDFGVRLPPERYCFTGAGWGLKEEWESETEEDGEEPDAMEGVREGGEENEYNEEDDFEALMGGGRDSEMADAP